MGKTAKPRSGAKWSEDEYQAHGYGRLNLRLPKAALDALDQRSSALRISRAKMIELLLTAQPLMLPLPGPTPEEVLEKLPLPKMPKRKK